MADAIRLLVVLHNYQDNVKTDYGTTYIQMGQRLWQSLTVETGYLLDRYQEQIVHDTGAVQKFHSGIDSLEQRAAWLCMVQDSHQEALRARLEQLATSPPHSLRRSALSVLRVNA